MKRLVFSTALFFLAAVCLPAQESGPYLIPQTIYVGDRARLVVPLGQAFSSVTPFVSTSPETLFRTGSAEAQRDENAPGAVISRIELEQRGGSPRLLIDFIPYVTGVIYFPSLLIPENNSLVISGLRVTVASILEPHEASLAGLAAPLAAPGTGVFIYSALAAALAVLFLCIGGGFWYKNHFAYFKMHLQRRRLLRAMDRLLKKLKVESLGGGNREELFSILSREFREFLSLFTGFDCRALTPGEFESLVFPVSEAVSGNHLFDIFSRWETIRFGGSGISNEDFFGVLDETHTFLNILDAAERSAKKNNSCPEDQTLAAEVEGAYV